MVVEHRQLSNDLLRAGLGRVPGILVWALLPCGFEHSFGLMPYKIFIKHITTGLSISGYVVRSKEESKALSKKLQDVGLYYRNHLIRVCSS